MQRALATAKARQDRLNTSGNRRPQNDDEYAIPRDRDNTGDYSANIELQDAKDMQHRPSEDPAGSPRETNRLKSDPYQSSARELYTASSAADVSAPIGEEHGNFNSFVAFMIFWEVAMIVLYFIFIRYKTGKADGNTDNGTSDADLKDAVQNSYPFYQDVHVMIFIGFGFLMTFLRRGGYLAVALTFLIAVFVIQWFILVNGFWENVFFHKDDWVYPEIDISILIRSDFAAGAILITYGVLLGKVTPLQLAVIALIETVFYSLNEHIALKLEVADIGGSMLIHEFGAFFGLALSMCLGAKKFSGNSDNAPVYHSDLFSMIGTVFLFMYWPSFNAALGAGNQQHRAVINTLLSISASCASAFICSHWFRGHRKFFMVDVQNATLAGGVAMGTAADMMISPGAAFLIGLLAGTVSTFGYVYISPYLEKKIGLHDTCGVLNLHGMPSIMGAVAGIIASRVAKVEDYGASLGSTFLARGADGLGRSAETQAGLQLAMTAITLAISVASGVFTGAFILGNRFLASVDKEDAFKDSAFFEVPANETPFYFDSLGGGVSGVPTGGGRLTSSDHDAIYKKLENRIVGLEAELASLYQTRAASDIYRVEQLFDRLIHRMDDVSRLERAFEAMAGKFGKANK